MSLENFVILILCTRASVDDLMTERKKHSAVAVDIIEYNPSTDYFKYKEEKFKEDKNEINLMFVFGNNDSVIVKDKQDISKVSSRLKNGEC